MGIVCAHSSGADQGLKSTPEMKKKLQSWLRKQEKFLQSSQDRRKHSYSLPTFVSCSVVDSISRTSGTSKMLNNSKNGPITGSVSPDLEAVDVKSLKIGETFLLNLYYSLVFANFCLLLNGKFPFKDLNNSKMQQKLQKWFSEQGCFCRARSCGYWELSNRWLQS